MSMTSAYKGAATRDNLTQKVNNQKYYDFVIDRIENFSESDPKIRTHVHF